MKERVFGFEKEDIADFYAMAQNGDFRCTVEEFATVRRKNPHTGKMCACYKAECEDGTAFLMTGGFFRYVFLPACEPQD